MRKSGVLLEKEGRENWIALPWFKARLVEIVLEKEG
jgi:hypothetical protein